MYTSYGPATGMQTGCFVEIPRTLGILQASDSRNNHGISIVA